MIAIFLLPNFYFIMIFSPIPTLFYRTFNTLFSFVFTLYSL
uniref:Uncharacterized protein n=1 Tax=Podoviridae sp. ct8nN1 TaxID=2827296 RepID=A0A8S5R494_9CAUD|nr:MAG TPA: hypothetical protein [Podoviridae sp. ct8nN1]